MMADVQDVNERMYTTEYQKELKLPTTQINLRTKICTS